MLLNHLVHKRLREHGFINLVVTVFAIAHDVDYGVRLPFHSPFGGEFHDPRHRFHVITVNVKHWNFHALSYIGAVSARA